jgi:ribosomal protein L35AE/L33A
MPISIGNYLERLYFRKNATGKIIEGKLMVFDGKKWMTEAEFDKAYPLPVITNFFASMDNADQTKSFLNS